MISSEAGSETGAPVVLVADDDPATVELIVHALKPEGVWVVKAANGDEALRLALELRPELSILDISMPSLNGIEVTRALRANPDSEHSAVVILTAAAEGHETDCLEAGADRFLTKPIVPRELREVVEAMLG